MIFDILVSNVCNPILRVLIVVSVSRVIVLSHILSVQHILMMVFGFCLRFIWCVFVCAVVRIFQVFCVCSFIMSGMVWVGCAYMFAYFSILHCRGSFLHVYSRIEYSCNAHRMRERVFQCGSYFGVL